MASEVHHKTPAPGQKNAIGKQPFFQPKLKVNVPNDVYEKEADAVAEKVVKSAEPEPAKTITPLPVTSLSKQNIQRDDERPRQEEQDPLTDGLTTAGEQLMDNNPNVQPYLDQLKRRFWEQQLPELRWGLIGFGIADALLLGAAFGLDAGFRRNTVTALEGVNLVTPLRFIPYSEFILPSTFTYNLPNAAHPNYQFNGEFDLTPFVDLLRDHHSGFPPVSPRFGLNLIYNPGSQQLHVAGATVNIDLFHRAVLLSGGINQWYNPDPQLTTGNDPTAPPVWSMQSIPSSQVMDTRFMFTIDVPRWYNVIRGRDGGAPMIQRKCAECEKEDAAHSEDERVVPFVQKKCKQCEAEEVHRKETDASPATATGSVERTIQSLGEPLQHDTLSFMEERFGYDFSNVQIHNDTTAHQSSDSINAKAYTYQNHIAFAKDQYNPETQAGKELLAHELTHVVQQTPSIQTKSLHPGRIAINNSKQEIARQESIISRKENDGSSISESVSKASIEPATEIIVQRKDEEKKPASKPVEQGASNIDGVKSFFAKTKAKLDLLFIVTGNSLTIYDKDGKYKNKYTLTRPGLIDVKGYYIGRPFGIGWAWIWQTDKGDLETHPMTKEAVAEIHKGTDTGKALAALNQELIVLDWLLDKDLNKFFKDVPPAVGLIGMSIVDTPIKTIAKENEGPQLSFALPEWFSQLKTKLEAKLVDERKTNKDNPLLPDKIFFYASDKVQAIKGADAWTIEVEKGKREAYYTIQKKQWEDASDKELFVNEVLDVLYKKVKLIGDQEHLEKEEQKEIAEIDGTGEVKKGSKWAWAVKLKKAIEEKLAALKAKEPAAINIPDKLTIATQQIEGAESAYLRVAVYKQNKEAKNEELPELLGGTIPIALKDGDKADDWIPVVRKAAEALRSGNISKEDAAQPTTGEADKEKADFSVLPAYPSFILPKDMNPDRTTVTTASNTFRMVVDTATAHGTNLLNLTTIHMGMSIGYSWKVYPLPDELKKLKEDPKTSPEQLVQQSNEYVRDRTKTLGVEKNSFKPDRDWEQSVKMSSLDVGDFILLGRAHIAYPEDWNMKRLPSIAPLPFTVKNAKDLADQSATSESDRLKELKKLAEETTDEKKKEDLLNQIKELEEREKSKLPDITQKDINETKTLLEKAEHLKKYILDEKKRGIPFEGDKNTDPFLLRLKKFDAGLYGIYRLIRQIYDFRYSDETAIDEYTKIIQQQLNELERMKKRIDRTLQNEKVHAGLPMYRVVGALVKEDDGNLVPLTLMIAHHKDSDPKNGKYKMMVLDMTFDSKKDDMVYVGDETDSERYAIRTAFVEFGKDNKYGDGKIVYRVPELGFKEDVDSVTTAVEYLGYALAAVGIALLIAGTVASGGLLSPAAAAAVGGVATYLGIATAVVGAALAGRNIYKRVEKGTFELDAEFALDVVNIIGAYAQVIGTAGKAMTTVSRGIGAAQKVIQLQRIGKLIAVYDALELSGNVVLLYYKVEEDIKAVKALNLPPEQEEQLMQQITLEAIQQGGMLAITAVNKVKDISEHIKTKIEESKYKSLAEKGWVDAEGHPTDAAPPFLRQEVATPGKAKPMAEQGEQAWKESQVFEMAGSPTKDGQHNLTVTEKGRIIRCSDFCTDLRMKYNEVLEKDPGMNSKMAELEARAQQAAKSGNKDEAAKVADDAKLFEANLKEADDLRKHLFGMSEAELDNALESMDAGKVTGGTKSGHKIDDIRIPKRQRRLLDIIDLMNPEEIAQLGKGGYKKAMERINAVMGKKISDIPELSKHWEATKAEVLGSKSIEEHGREGMIAKYKEAQRKFWDKVRKDPAAVDFLKKHGFDFEGEGGAVMASLGPNGKLATDRGTITDQERRISLDHIQEKAQGENWQKALDGDNLELMFQNANSQKEITQVKFKMR